MPPTDRFGGLLGQKQVALLSTSVAKWRNLSFRATRLRIAEFGMRIEER